MKSIYSFAIILISFAIVACSSVSTPVSPPPIPTTTPEATITPLPSSTPMPEDLTYDVKSKCIRILEPGFKLKKVLDAPFGLMGQVALLPDGKLVVSEYGSNRITLVGRGSYQRLVSGDFKLPPVVAALPDGQVVYSNGIGIYVIDPASGKETSLGFMKGGHSVMALTTDSAGTIYAATSKGSVYKIKAAVSDAVGVISNLPYANNEITDMDVAEDGTIYVAGYGKVVAISGGAFSIIVPDLNIEPVFIEVAPNGMLYIDDVSDGLQQYNPSTGQLSKYKGLPTFGDIMFPSDEEMIFYYPAGAFYHYDFRTKEIEPFFLKYGNSHAFAVSKEGIPFFASPNIPGVNDANIASVEDAGEVLVHESMSYPQILSADFDFEQNMCLATNQGFYCYRNDELVRSIQPAGILSGEFGPTQIALGPNGDWYIIKSNNTDNIQVYRLNESGVTTLPITFTNSSFNGAYRLDDVSIDVGSDGQLVLIVTALGSKNEGPYLQRVYRADANGENLTEIANFDSSRIAGMVDIAIAPNHEIFVLTVQDGYQDMIYKIDEDNNQRPVVGVCGGHDPTSIDVDANGHLWFSTTTGIFQVLPKDVPE
jgi:hypothetical protein